MIILLDTDGPIQIVHYALGSNHPKIFGRVSLTPQDITGYTVEMRIEHPDDSIFTVSGAITNGPTGLFEIPGGALWPEGAIVNGDSKAPIRFVSPSGAVVVFPQVLMRVVRT